MVSAKARRFIRRHIKRHIRELKMPPKQAVAVALAEAREKGFQIPPPRNPHLTRQQLRSILGPKMAGLGKDVAEKLKKAFRMELR